MAIQTDNRPRLADQLPRRISHPSAASLSLVTSTAQRIAPASDSLAPWYSNYVRAHRARLAVDLDLINRLDLSRSARMLDVGAIPPVLVACLKSGGREAVGVDIAPDRFEGATAEFDLDIRACNVETERLPFGDDTFDLVIVNEVFEHLRINPIATFREITRVLAPAGLLSLSTPNARSSRGLFNFVIAGRGGWCGAPDVYGEYEKLETLGHMGHVREYTVTDVTQFLLHFELTPVAVVWRGLDPVRRFRAGARLIPSLSPFMSIVMRKQPSGQRAQASSSNSSR